MTDVAGKFVLLRDGYTMSYMFILSDGLSQGGPDDIPPDTQVGDWSTIDGVHRVGWFLEWNQNAVCLGCLFSLTHKPSFAEEEG